MKRTLIGLAFLLTTSAINAEISSVITFPAGANGDIQFNRNRTFGADIGQLTYSTATKTLGVPLLSVSTITIRGITYYFPSSQTGGSFLRTDGAGGLTWEAPTSVAVSTGTALEIWDGLTVISSPTAGIRFNEDQFIVSLQGGATALIQLNTSSVTVMGVLSADTPITLTGSNFSLDKSSVTLRGPDPTLAGDLSGTISNATVIDDSHNHTTVSISGLDISADTNLAASPPIVLVGDTVTIDKSSVTLLGPSIEASELPSDGYASTYVNTSGDTMTGQLTISGSSFTVTGAGGLRSSFGISGGSLTARNLANTLVAVDANGVLISTTVAIPNPGSATIAVSTGTVIISSPTAQIDFNGSQFAGSLVGTATTQICLLTSSVTLQGQNVIRLMDSLQSGATFYVSSGTVAGQFRAADVITTGDITVGDDASITGGLTISGGSGATISSLTGNRCVETDTNGKLVSASGTCNAGLGASSMAVFKDGVQISSPTGTIDFIGEGFALGLTGSNTAQVTIVSTTAYTSKNQTWTAPNTASSSWTFTTVEAHTVNISSKVVWADGSISTTAATVGSSGSIGTSVYPATATASFPFGLTASTITMNGKISSLTAGTTTNDAATFGQLQNLSAANANILINGGMEIWQRGTSIKANNNSYAADRWKFSSVSSNNGLVFFSRESSTVHSGRYSMKVILASTATLGAITLISQPIENYYDYAGSTVSFSIWVNTTDNALWGNIQDSNGSTATNSVTTSGWQLLTATRYLSSNITSLEVNIGDSSLNPGTTTYIDSAILVKGTGPAIWNARLLQQELALCQRYYEKSYAIDTTPGTSTSTNNIFPVATAIGANSTQAGPIPFMVEKRAAPTVTVYTNVGTVGEAVWYTAAGVGTSRSSALSEIGTKSFNISQSNNNAEFHALFHWTADAEM